MGVHGRSEPPEVLVDGRPDRSIGVEDRGLHYGDGLFETIAFRGGRPCLWQAHLDRLRAGAVRLGIPPPSDGLLREEVRRLLDGQDAGTLKLMLTRGIGPRGYRPPALAQPTRILLRYPIAPPTRGWSEPAVAVTLCRVRMGANPALAGLKHLNRLEQVMARSEWDDPAIAEGLLCDARGRLVGGTMTNLFLVRDGRLRTPRLDEAGVAGTVRARVLHHARALGMALYEEHLYPRDLEHADGAFLTNALIGCQPIGRVDGLALDAGAVPSDLLACVQRDVFEPEPDW